MFFLVIDGGENGNWAAGKEKEEWRAVQWYPVFAR